MTMDLKDMLDKKEVKFKDVEGKEHTLKALNLMDLSDFQDKFGNFEKLKDEAYLKIKFHLYVLWLSLRKNGLTQEEINKEEWKIGLQTVAGYLPTKIDELVNLTNKLFAISGLINIPDEKEKDIQEKNVQSGGK